MPILRTLSPTERKQRVGKSPTLRDNQPTSDSMTQIQFLSSREMQRKYEFNTSRTPGAIPIYSTGNVSRRIMHCYTTALPSFVPVRCQLDAYRKLSETINHPINLGENETF
ncbi:uncharacterized protein EAE98_005028 [Botrytis deweyae]|nr:uncharacterized protein EAE98_005028 [Botrytis deweyae]KAF7930628.1 hypothetical protein EAE98_005028 [Botrytis deweyae]